jgi:predicted nucleic acid-binding protein
MTAADTGTWVAFLEGEGGDDVQRLAMLLANRHAVMAPAVLAELLSDPELPVTAVRSLSALPLIDVEPGYWQRAGRLRARVLAKGRRARLGDALIAQSCIDGRVGLITRDRDFRAFAGTAGLHLLTKQAESAPGPGRSAPALRARAVMRAGGYARGPAWRTESGTSNLRKFSTNFAASRRACAS